MSPTQTLTISVRGASHTLEARLARARPGAPLAVIAPPHPVYGGTIGNPVVRTLEHALAQQGYTTLAFNFRGTGESTGEPSGDLDDAQADYLAAARAVSDAELGLVAGYSFGAIAALDAAITLSAPRTLMVAPPLSLLDASQLARLPGQLLVVLGDADEYAPLDEARPLFATRPRTRLAVLEQVEHFFLGGAVPRLATSLTALLGDAPG
ncbi:MAG: alpha/beta fold hydrolase [Polyangiales bacterium]